MKTLTRRIFIALALMMCCISISAQSTYRAQLKEMMQLNGMIENLKSMNMNDKFATVVDLLKEKGRKMPAGYTSKQLADKYFNSAFLDDAVIVFEPYFAKSVSESDLRAVNAQLRSAEVRTAIKNGARLNSDEGMKKIIPDIEAGIKAIVKGEPVPTVKTKASPQRAALFRSYYQASKMDQMISPLIDAFTAGNKDLTDDVKTKMKNYFRNNMCTLLLNASEGILTNRDLQCSTKMFTTTQYKKVQDVAMTVLQNPTVLGTKLIERFVFWLDKQ